MGTKKPRKILVVEDEKAIGELITYHLQKEGYQARHVGSGEEAIELLKGFVPDLAVLDILLPQISGLQLCQYIKTTATLKGIPVIILSALGEEEDVVKGLELGADDYVTKPFSPKILLARVKAVLKRYNATSSSELDQNVVSVHGFTMDRAKHRVWVEDQERQLTATEFAILEILMSEPGTVFTRSQMVNRIRGDNHAITDRSVDFQMVGLRKKVAPHGEIIESVRGVGYRFAETKET